MMKKNFKKVLWAETFLRIFNLIKWRCSNLKTYSIVVLYCLCFSTRSYSQLAQFPTPNAASLGVFNQYPQSSFTGVPSISVPLWEVKYEGIELPIQLSYNNNLVKPNQDASWVGLGWNLSSGGAINRVVNGKPDDANWYKGLDWYSTRNTGMGYFYNHGYLSNNWLNSGDIENAFYDSNNLPDELPGNWEREVKTIRDYSPDEFSFSVGSLNGSFYMDHQGNWKVRSNNKVKVVVDQNTDFATKSPPSNPYSLPAQRYLMRIMLIDNQGIKYVFGGSSNSIEDVRSEYDFFIKTWYLTTIILPNNKIISFGYESGQNVPLIQPISYYLEYDENGFVHGPGLIYAHQTNHPAYIKTITTDLEEVRFERTEVSNQYAKLNSIIVKSLTDNRQVARFDFHYQYSPTNKLKLYSVVRKDATNLEGSHYFFQYNALDFSTINNNIDSWGYYTSRPFDRSSRSAFNYSKSADTANCRAELLDRIVYPTGGYVRYTWEPNSYSKAIANNRRVITDYPVNQYAGGARIKQVTVFDAGGTKINSKKYFYNRDFQNTNPPANNSSGVLFNIPSFDYFSNGRLALLPTNPLIENNVGSHISYSEVTQVNDDGSFTTTQFSNFDTGTNNEYLDEVYLGRSNLFNEDDEFTSNSHERGVPLKVSDYKNTGELVHEQLTTYVRINKANEFVKTYRGRFLDPRDQLVAGKWIPRGLAAWALRIYTNSYLPETVTEKFYSNALLTSSKTITYYYDNSTLNVTKITEQNSLGQPVETQNKYTGDVPDPTGVFASMLSNNNTAQLVETISKVDNAITKTVRSNFEQITPGQYKVVSQTYQHPSSTTPRLIAQYQYNNQGQVVTALQNGIKPTAYLYGYAGNLAIAKIENALHTEIFHENFESYGTFGQAHTGDRYNAGAYAVSFAIPNNRAYKLTYWYRVNNVWNYAVESYVTPRSILPAGADAIDDVCVFPSDAQMTTYTYRPLVGISSVIDPKGITLYYEYDGFGRLVDIKDQFGFIKTHYCYNYAGQETDCLVATAPEGELLQTVYAKLETTNIQRNDSSIGYIDGSTVNTTVITGDIKIRFYADSQGKIPIALNRPQDVRTSIYNIWYNEYESGNYESYNEYTTPSGSDYYFLGNMTLSFNQTINSPDTGYSYTVESYYYSLIPNTNNTYIIIP